MSNEERVNLLISNYEYVEYWANRIAQALKSISSGGLEDITDTDRKIVKEGDIRMDDELKVIKQLREELKGVL